MNNPKLYTVKEAAKVVGVSTNTLYKYLDEGKIHAARGSAQQGRFRIPESALEEFLGVTLAEPDVITPTAAVEPVAPRLQPLTLPEPKKTRLPVKLARLLLVVALIAILADLFISRAVSLPGTIARICLIVVMLLLAYGEGGYRSRRQGL